MQQTDFDWELVIGDDGSTDGTSAICQQYAAAHPHRIRYYYRSRKNRPILSADVNVNRYNLVETFKTAGGQYIAWLDGDDYYTDVQQLQKAKQFFNANPDCKIIFTDAHDVDANRAFLHDVTSAIRRNLNPDDLIFNCPVTSSLMFEYAAIADLLQQPAIWQAPALDLFLMATLSCNSYMGYVPTLPVGYRFHGANMRSEKSIRRFHRTTLINALLLYNVLRGNCVQTTRKRILIASRVNVKYNLRHFNIRYLLSCIRMVTGYVQQSGDWKFFIDFWNRKLLYQRSS